MRALYVIESYSGQGRKYMEIPRIKYLVVQKCGTKYQKEWNQIPLTLLIGFLKIPSIDQQPRKIQGKYPLVLYNHCNRARMYFAVISKTVFLISV